jgi:myo-inositol-1-phosphate synthase
MPHAGAIRCEVQGSVKAGMDTIRTAIVGVGNCASSLTQGIAYCRHHGQDAVGLPYPMLGGYAAGDVDIVCAFDVDARKVGIDLSSAIFAPPNCTARFWPDMAPMSVPVRRGRTLDGVSDLMSRSKRDRSFRLSDAAEPDRDEIVSALKETGTQVVINFLPVGSQEASAFYAECALEAGAALVNAIPVFLASDPAWSARFAERGIPILGDDFKAQIGATVVQRVLAHLFGVRGAQLDRVYQLNVGGNTDFLNMMDGNRLSSKRESKTEAVQSAVPERLDEDDIRIGPSDYVPWLNDQKVAYMRLEGRLLGGVPMNMEVRMSVEDSPNAAAMALIAIRCARIALDRGLSGSINDACAFLFKHPPEQLEDLEACELLERFAASAPAKPELARRA